MNNDKHLAFLKERGYTGTINDAYRAYLLAQLGVTSNGTIDDLLYRYLKLWNYSGSLDDMLATHLRYLGYSGSVADMLAAAWPVAGIADISFAAAFSDAGSGAVNTSAFGLGSTTPTFTRATTATTVNSAGTIISVASGTPRSYYDPTTLQYLGYLAEGARTNLCLQSEALGTTWAAPTGMALAANNTTAPDGATTADKLTDDSGTSGHYIEQTGLTFSTATAYTFSAFVKWASGTRNVFLQFYTNAGADQAYVILNSSGSIVTSAAVGSMASVSASVKSYPSGWYRVTVTGTTGVAAGAGAVRLGHGNGSSAPPPGYTGNGTDASYWWGAQLEAGAFASTYIPTTTASVPRNADVLTYPYAGNALNTVGSCYAELSSFWSSGTNGLANSAVTLGIGAQNFLLGVTFTVAATQIRIMDGSTTAASGTGASMQTGSRKCASSWSTTANAKRAAFAGTVGSDATIPGTFDSTAIGIGCATNGSQNWEGTIRNVRIYSTQLSATRLGLLTT